MSYFFLDIKASGNFSADNPSLQVLIGGDVVSSFSLDDEDSQIYRLSIENTGALPNDISIRFQDGLGEAGRSVTVQTVRVNGRL